MVDFHGQGLIPDLLCDTRLPVRVMSREFRHIVRVVGTDVDGSKKVIYGITRIRGMGPSFAAAVVKAAQLKPEMRVGSLTEEEVDRIEDVMANPTKYNLPPRLFNRRKDFETGRDGHLIGPDLTLKVKSDINFMRELRTWKGIRHSLGLKVRGQRTKSTGRKGRAVGVKKRAAIAAARAAAREGRSEEKK